MLGFQLEFHRIVSLKTWSSRLSLQTDVASRGAQLEDVHVYMLLLNVLISTPPAGFLLDLQVAVK